MHVGWCPFNQGRSFFSLKALWCEIKYASTQKGAKAASACVYVEGIYINNRFFPAPYNGCTAYSIPLALSWGISMQD
jgi:hypothetical protein